MKGALPGHKILCICFIVNPDWALVRSLLSILWLFRGTSLGPSQKQRPPLESLFFVDYYWVKYKTPSLLVKVWRAAEARTPAHA